MRYPSLAEFYATPDAWPMWPFLPVKTANPKFMKPEYMGFPALGLMTEGSARVYDANLFDGVSDLSKVLGDYKTVEEAEADGWKVD